MSDFNRFSEWNPYAKLDPEAKIQIKGPASTLGSSYVWEGQESGQGKMTTSELFPLESHIFRIDFLKPMAVVNHGSFTLADGGELNLTRVTWAMWGTYEGFRGIIGRTVHLFVSLDKMLGSVFEDGLQSLKAICEKPA